MRSFSRSFLLLITLVSAGACYRYVPSETGAIPAGTEVRARLTDEGRAEARQYFGPDVTSVTGPLVRWDGEGIGLLTEMTLSRAGFPATVMTDTIRFLPQHLSGVDVKELDGKRTLWFTAGVAGAMAGAVIATRYFGGSERDHEGEGGEGGDPEAAILVRFAIFRIPFRIGFP